MSERHGLYINGQWREGSTGEQIGVINPATEEIIEQVPYGGRDDARAALEAAQSAFGSWRELTAYERGEILQRTAQLIRERAEEIARWVTQEVGKPLGESLGEVNAAAAYYKWFAEEGKRAYGRIVPPSKPGVRRWVMKQPVGVCAAISPWNFPVLLPARKIAAALAAGCTIVSRPSSRTPLGAMEMIGCLHDAGCPPGVVNQILGPAAECADEFMNNPICRKVSFTGSTAVGRQLIAQSAEHIKKLSLELGGSAPVLIFPDVDVERVAAATVRGKFRNMGQVCIAATRFYVHESIFDEYVDAAARYTSSLKLGNGLDDGVDCGPLADQQSLEKVEQFVADAVAKGAEIVVGGKRAPGFQRGFFFEPTVLTNVTGAMRLTCEEVFGPIMPIMSFGTTAEAIGLANDTEYGLASYVFTEDLSTALQVVEQLEFGIVGLNDMVPATAEAPFGGIKESGYGREGGQEGLEPYLETKYISVGLNSLH